MEEEKDVQVESSTATDVNTESSTVESEEATSQEATQETDQHVPYDRFKEVNEERNYWRDQYTQLVSKPQATVQQDDSDPWAHLPADQRLFMQEWEKRNQKLIHKVMDEKEQSYRATIEALASQNARIQEKLFRQEQVDVKPGSKEEAEIANFIRMGMDPDKAAWAVMGPKRVESAKLGKQQQKQVKTQLKARANLESEGIPPQSGVPTGKKISFREDFDRRMRESGL